MAEKGSVDVRKIVSSVMSGNGDEALRMLKRLDLAQVEGLAKKAGITADPADVLGAIQDSSSIDELLKKADELGISLKDLAGLAGGFLGLFG